MFEQFESTENTSKLPPLDDGEIATITRLELKEKLTREPKPYSEATLLEDMVGASKFVEDPELRKAFKNSEMSGIGTAATRAETIEKLKQNELIRVSGKTLEATEKGLEYVKWLDAIAPEMTDVALTALWQAELDKVALVGGGKAFEDSVAANVRRLISIFQVAPPMRLASTSTTKGTNSMSDTPRSNKPSDKMLEFAKRIAVKVGNGNPPDEAMKDWDACKAYIDANKDAAMRPSEKQVNFATRIAKEKSLTIPDEALKDGRELSKWIDENKDN